MEGKIRQLEQKILECEDREKIREMNCQYFYNVDNHHPEKVVSLFAEDAEVDAGPLGTYKGIDQLKKFYLEMVPAALPMSLHFLHNQIITLKGSEAIEQSSFTGHVVLSDGRPAKFAGDHTNYLRKEKRNWKFTKKEIHFYYFLPYEEPWSVERKIMKL